MPVTLVTESAIAPARRCARTITLAVQRATARARVVRRVLSTGALLVFGACAGGADAVAGNGGNNGNSGNNGGTGGTPARLDVSTSAVGLGAVGASETVTATVRDANGGIVPGASVSWTSSDITVADVSGIGTTAVITARAPGQTTIRAIAGAFTQSIAVTVHVVRTIALVSSATVRAGGQITLVPTLDADAGANLALRWLSENPAVASVSSSGVVSGLAPGTSNIRVTLIGDARVTAVTQLTVTAARSVAISNAPALVFVGDEQQLTATLDVDSTDSRALEWRSDNPTVASVTSGGRLLAIGVGTAKIRVSSAAFDGVRDSVMVQVARPRLVTVTPSSATLVLGGTRVLSAEVQIEEGLSTAVQWRSENAAVAMVAQNGMVTAVSPGTANIVAVSVADTMRRGLAAITVTAAVRDIDVSPSAVSLFTGDSRQLQASVEADAGVPNTVMWRSSNPSVASVSNVGVVTGLASGTAMVTAMSTVDTTKQASAIVTVRSAPVVSIAPASVTLTLNQQRQLVASVQADAGVSTAVTWRSEQPDVVSVTSNGLVTAVAIGTVRIVATSVADTSRHAFATIVVAPIVRSISLNAASMAIAPAETRSLIATVTADSGASTAVLWRSSNAAVATVSGTGAVTGLAVGTTTITALAAGDTTKVTSASVTVRAAPVVTVSPATNTLNIGDQRTITATVTAGPGVSTAVTWRSSNTAVATVSAGGVVTAIGLGTVLVTATSVADTSADASATVTVAPEIQSVSVSPSSAALAVGGSVQLMPSVVAQGGLAQSVTYRSSNPAVASVNFAGTVSALGTGSATITVASTVDPTKLATAAITVSATTPRMAVSWSAARLGGALYEDVVSLDAIDASNAFAVNSKGDVYRYSGGAWTLSASGASFGTHFNAVNGPSVSTVVAVGTNGVIAHFNGASWNVVPSNTAQALYGVFMEGSSVGYAVGGGGTALRYNGSAWTTTNTGTTQILNGVWSMSGTAFAVGTTGEVLRYSGGSWIRQVSGVNDNLNSVFGVSTSNVVAVGAAGTVLRYNGTSWSKVNGGNVSVDLYGVTGSTANSNRYYVASDDGLYQLNNNSLSAMSTPYAPRLLATSMDGTGSVWTSGQRGAVMRLSGASWDTQNIAPDLYDVWTTSTSNAWAVGDFGFIYRWNGSAWTRQTSPTTNILNTVWGASSSEAFAGGDNGTMLRWNGSTWNVMSFPSTGSVYGIWGSSATNVYAVTSLGQVVRWNGASWSVVTTTAGALWAVHGSSASNVYVSGESGIALRFNGTTWSSFSAPTSGTMAGIWVGDASNILAVGGSSVGSTNIGFRSTGSGWSGMSLPVSSPLNAIWGPNDDDVYAAGANGALLRWDGSNWSAMASGTTDVLWSVTGAPGGNGGGFAVGYNSTIVSATSGNAFTAAGLRVQRTVSGSLNPAAGVPVVRGALPSGKARARRAR